MVWTCGTRKIFRWAFIVGRFLVYLDPKQFGVTYQLGLSFLFSRTSMSNLANKEQDGPLRGSFLICQQHFVVVELSHLQG